MTRKEKVNILMVDDQPAKLLSYEVILGELGENLIKASTPHEALGILLKTDIAVVLIDVVMPQIDGFQLAAMIREHPRFQKLAMIFVSGVQIADTDHLRGYEIGAVDYVAVPVASERLEWDDGQYRVYGVDRARFQPTRQAVLEMVHPDDRTIMPLLAGAGA